MGGGGGSSGGGGGYSANRNPKIRATRRPLFDNIRKNGMTVNNKQYTLSVHVYNNLFKSGRKDIMPNDIKEALKNIPVKAEGNSVVYKNPFSGTRVFVNPDTNYITGVYPKDFID